MFTYILDKREGGFTCLLIYLTLFTRGKEGVYMFTYILDTVYKREGGGLHVYLYTWHCLQEGRRGLHVYLYT